MPVDGFRLAYEREGTGPAVVLLHGWPGDHADYRAVTPFLSDHADVLVPDLRGFGASDKHPEDPRPRTRPRRRRGACSGSSMNSVCMRR
jgi:pimeloyl-ACP methyl ester carboxylesterase